MKIPFSSIEERLKAFIESSFHLFPWQTPNLDLPHHLVEAMQSAQVEDENGNTYAPGTYTIYLSHKMASKWQSNGDLVLALTRVLKEAAEEANIHFSTPLTIHLAEDALLPANALRIEAFAWNKTVGETGAISNLNPSSTEFPNPRPANAFLIVNGNQNFPLRLAVVNIGRRIDNHLVINDPRVSRTHAQLRASHGHYILLDLNASGGTFVNGERVSQWTLSPGDVISLAGVPLIYGEDATSLNSTTTDTSEMSIPPQSDAEGEP